MRFITKAMIVCMIVLVVFTFYYVVYYNNPCSLDNVVDRVFSLTQNYTYAERVDIAKQVIARGDC